MSDVKEKVGCGTYLLAIFTLGPLMWVGTLIYGAKKAELSEWGVRFAICLGLIILAVVYYALQTKALWRLFFGLIEIGTATVSNWHQIGLFAQETSKNDMYDRFVFVALGTAVLARGVKDFLESVDMLSSNNKRNPSPSRRAKAQ